MGSYCYLSTIRVIAVYLECLNTRIHHVDNTELTQKQHSGNTETTQIEHRNCTNTTQIVPINHCHYKSPLSGRHEVYPFLGRGTYDGFDNLHVTISEKLHSDSGPDSKLFI